jgi:malate permease and related proteins
MSHFALLGICLLAGILLRYWKRLPQNTPVVLNGFIFHLSLPALTLVEFHDVTFTRDSALPILMAWLFFFFAWAYIAFLKNWKSLGIRSDWKAQGALILTAGLGNTSFVGYPMLEGV